MLSQARSGGAGGQSLSLSGGGSTATEAEALCRDGYLDVGSANDGGGPAAVDPNDWTSSAVDDPGGPLRGPGPPPRAHARPVEGDAGNAHGSLAPTYGQVAPALSSASTNPDYART